MSAPPTTTDYNEIDQDHHHQNVGGSSSSNVEQSSSSSSAIKHIPSAPYPPMMSMIKKKTTTNYKLMMQSSLRNTSTGSTTSTATVPIGTTTTTSSSSTTGLASISTASSGSVSGKKLLSPNHPTRPLLYYNIGIPITTIRACPSISNLYSTINCYSHPADKIANSSSSVRIARQRQQPVLLEFHQFKKRSLDNHHYENEEEEDDLVAAATTTTDTTLFSRADATITALLQHQQGSNTGNPSRGTSSSNVPIGSSSSSTSNSMFVPPLLYSTCQSWCPTAPRVVTGLSNGGLCLHALDFEDDFSHSHITVEPILIRHNRPTSAVSWRPNGGSSSSHVVMGWWSGNHINNNNNINTSTSINNMNNSNPTAVAASLASSTSSPSLLHHGPQRRGFYNNSNVAPTADSTIGSDANRYSLALWDVESSTHQPIVKFGRASSSSSYLSSLTTTTTASSSSQVGSHAATGSAASLMGVASMAWKHHHLLLVGCSQRYLQLYDLRVPPASNLVSTTWAHADAVWGTTCSNNNNTSNNNDNHGLIATFSDRVVKLWDWRKMDTSVGEISFDSPHHRHDHHNYHHYHHYHNTTSKIASIQWTNDSNNTLSVALDNGEIHRYDTTTSKPLWVGQTKLSSLDDEGGILDIDTTHGYRYMVIRKSDRTIQNVAKQTRAPLVVSRKHMIHSFQDKIWTAPFLTMGAETTRKKSSSFLARNPSVMTRLAASTGDISFLMMKRAACIEKSHRYSIDALRNVEIIQQQQQQSVADYCDPATLIQLWTWIARVEKSSKAPTSKWKSSGLLDAGIWNLLAMDEAEDVEQDSTTISPTLQCEVYDSSARRAALLACGWSTESGDVADILNDCVDKQQFERAAALAVWHDDIGTAVDLLQSHCMDGAPLFTYHQEPTRMQQMVSICIAGFNGTPVWQQACRSLLNQSELKHDKSNGAAYLRSILKFLLNIQHQQQQKMELDCVLDDSSLSLCDRIAFACRFLKRNDLKKQLEKWTSACQMSGNLEGLIITGLVKSGFAIIQAFVDQFGDVQTAALITSRVVLPDSWEWERSVCSEWLDAYRGLLNEWQMWQSRAIFDVERAELLRSMEKNETRPKKSKSAADAILNVCIPAQLEARCNYCSMPLSGARRQEGVTSLWLSKSKSVLSCCPRCRKPLPRCAICLLSLGCLNPFTEFQQAQQQQQQQPLLQSQRRAAATQATNNNLPFGEWFTWCMSCKHGGHAHHLIGWFAKHEVCPVSGCDCHCQFDGIQRLGKTSKR